MYTLCERKLSPMLIKFPPKGGQILKSETPPDINSPSNTLRPPFHSCCINVGLFRVTRCNLLL